MNPLAHGIVLDTYSGIVKVDGRTRVIDLVDALATTSWMWPFPASNMTIADCLSQRMDGWERGDPVAQIICGLQARLPNGELIDIRPAPRRAVGPDFVNASFLSPGLWSELISAHLIVCPTVPCTDLAYAFPTLDDARAARAWLRGRGVHPLAIRVSNTASSQAILQLRLAESMPAVHKIIDEVAQRFQGRHIGQMPPVLSQPRRVSHPVLHQAACQMEPSQT